MQIRWNMCFIFGAKGVGGARNRQIPSVGRRVSSYTSLSVARLFLHILPWRGKQEGARRANGWGRANEIGGRTGGRLIGGVAVNG